MPMGVLAPGSAHARPSARPPINMSGNPKFRNPRTTFENTPLSALKCHSAGVGPRIIFLIGILIFLLLRSPCKISQPYDNPFWDFSKGGAKKKINLPIIVAYLSLLRWSHALRSDQNVCSHRWGSLILGLRTLDPFLGPHGKFFGERGEGCVKMF